MRSNRNPPWTLRLAAACLLGTGIVITGLLGACAPEPAPEAAPEPGPRVEHPGLGIALASVPVPFEVVSAEGDTVVLAAPGPAGAAELTIAAGPVERFGINLVDAVMARKAAFEEAPGGVYHGNRELRAPIGTAFTARGAYEGDSGPVEETWIYAIHPSANRMLTLTYAYPPEESGTRAPQVLDVLGEIEGLAPPSDPAGSG